MFFLACTSGESRAISPAPHAVWAGASKARESIFHQSCQISWPILSGRGSAGASRSSPSSLPWGISKEPPALLCTSSIPCPPERLRLPRSGWSSARGERSDGGKRREENLKKNSWEQGLDPSWCCTHETAKIIRKEDCVSGFFCH